MQLSYLSEISIGIKLIVAVQTFYPIRASPNYSLSKHNEPSVHLSCLLLTEIFHFSLLHYWICEGYDRHAFIKMRSGLNVIGVLLLLLLFVLFVGCVRMCHPGETRYYQDEMTILSQRSVIIFQVSMRVIRLQHKFPPSWQFIIYTNNKAC